MIIKTEATEKFKKQEQEIFKLNQSLSKTSRYLIKGFYKSSLLDYEKQAAIEVAQEHGFTNLSLELISDYERLQMLLTTKELKLKTK